MRYRFLRFRRITSTNDVALKLAEEGAPEGTVIVADYQTHGRGRGKRRWISSPGKNLLFTLLLRPDVPAGQGAFLTILAAQAIQRILSKRYGLRATIKKPNDVLVSRRKISGILVESRSRKGHLEFAVVGMGVNVNSTINELPVNTTSINEEIGRKTSKNDLLMMILVEFSRLYVNKFEKSPLMDLHQNLVEQF